MQSLRPSDLEQLEQRGIAPAEAERQLEQLARPPRPTRLDRAAVAGDGVVQIDDSERVELLDLHARASAAGRFTKFVPASGAASRMFKDLLQFSRGSDRAATRADLRGRAEAGDSAARAVERFLAELPRFAFDRELQRALGADPTAVAAGDGFREVIEALLCESGLGYETLPKGLLAFHRHPDGSRTPFEEHLAEAASYSADRNGGARLHFTVSPEHRERFEARFRAVEERLRRTLGVEFNIDYSAQKPSTDTLAAEIDGSPARDRDGRLLFRPGGHGALIENLNELNADLVYVKNIDNVQPEHRRGDTLAWKRLLGGYLVRLKMRTRDLLDDLRGGDEAACERAARRVGAELGTTVPAGDPSVRRGWLIDRLDRPMRVCGVVPNTGEPGGGPYWVRGAGGELSRQIVETAQMDLADGSQRTCLQQATHFNPVDLVCAVRDANGRRYDLHRFIDEQTAIVTRKSAQGRELLALERPGLWNGAMAGWNTVFVEVPLATFSPVKTVLDLLRPEHQGTD